MEEAGSWGDFAHIIPFVETDTEPGVLPAPPISTIGESRQMSLPEVPGVRGTKPKPVREQSTRTGHLCNKASAIGLGSSKSLKPVQKVVPSLPEIKEPSIMEDLEDDISCPICMNVM